MMRRCSLLWDDEALKYTEEEKQGWTLTVYKSNDGASADEGAPAVEQMDEGAPEVAVDEMNERAPAPAVDETDERAPAVEQTDEGAPEVAVDEMNERAPAPAVDERAPAVEQTDEGAPAPAVEETDERAHVVEQTDEGAPAHSLRGRPRKSTDPKKFTTPEQTTRVPTRSRWVSSPFTEADIDEIEGRKKKPRTEA
ncbi:hypothetical protein Rs2_02771 [Raphanus sativus]|nr:hypothetical protein Rs2_02771 [Raphanus sativus]